MTGAIVLIGAMLSIFTPASAAPPPVLLGTAELFAILAGSAITNTGPSVINGDVGVHPGTSITGFGGNPNGTVNGDIHEADAVAAQAKEDLTAAYNDAAGRDAVELAQTELGGRTLVAGVYHNATLGLTGTVTLDGAGDPSSVWIFQADSTLITGSGTGATVDLTNGADPCNVFWQVGSSATLGATTTFVGTIMAQTAITLGNGVTVEGRALARTAEVTLINDVFNLPECAAPPTPTDTTGTTTATTTTGTGTGTTTTGTTTTGTGTGTTTTGTGTGTTTTGTTTTGTGTGTTTTGTTTTGTGTGTTTTGTGTGTTTTGTTTTGTTTTGTTTTGTTTTGTTTTGTGTGTTTTGTTTTGTGTGTTTTGTTTTGTGTGTTTTGTTTTGTGTGTTTDTTTTGTDTTDTSTSTRTTRSGGGGGGNGGGGLAFTGTTLPTMSLAGIGAGIALIGTGLVLMPRRTRAKHA